MFNKLKLALTIDCDETGEYKNPIIVGIFLVYIATIFVQNTYQLSLHSVIVLTIAIIIHILLYLFSNVIFKHRYWLYFIAQGIIVFDCAIIMPKGYVAIFLGLIPLLIFQSMVVYYDAIKVIITSVFFYSIFCGTMIAFNGVDELIRNMPILVLITIAVRAYSVFFLKQVSLSIQNQKVLKELELAYEKVEELTLTNERQRMARDLHDTLSQGLVGIIMQLEAVNAHLNNNNTKRAQQIVKKSMVYARATLADSRLVIDDLRFKSNTDIDFTKAIENEIAEFNVVSKASTISDIRIESQIPIKTLKHILYIVREALNNIAKHAKAENVVVKIIEYNNILNINVIDDGIGFDIKLLDKLFGHYGMLGMSERIRAINGKFEIKSKIKAGTNINIIIPIERGIDE